MLGRETFPVHIAGERGAQRNLTHHEIFADGKRAHDMRVVKQPGAPRRVQRIRARGNIPDEQHPHRGAKRIIHGVPLLGTRNIELLFVQILQAVATGESHAPGSDGAHSSSLPCLAATLLLWYFVFLAQFIDGARPGFFRRASLT